MSSLTTVMEAPATAGLRGVEDAAIQVGEPLSRRGRSPGQTHDDGWDQAPIHLLCLTSIVRQKTLAVLLAGSELRQRRQELGWRIVSRVIRGRHTE